MQNPRGEWMVLLPHTPKVFLRGHLGAITGVIRQEVVLWLVRNVGINSGLRDVNAKEPWRARVWAVGDNSQHCFFFHHKKDAVLFKLTWA